ncbi:MAG: hypothetical protein RBR53_02790 [Desulforegulaceae bacterium]|nr:hypothetical protein [Desulforegulaceae bacterium]
MSAREKIILIFAGIALLWGIFEIGSTYIWNKDSKSPGTLKSRAEIDQDISTLTANISAQVSSADLSAKEKLIISKGNQSLDKDPFINFKELESMNTKGTTKAGNKGEGVIPELTSYKYLGYIKINELEIAVINNLDYLKNEQIEGSKYKLKEISPSSVILSDGLTSVEIFNEETKSGLK